MAGESDRDNSVDRLLKGAMRTSLAPASASCLDAERLAAWSDGALADADAHAIDAHLADCARCQAMLAVFARTMPAAPAPVPFWSRRLVQWMVPLVTAAAAMVVWTLWPRVQPAVPSVQTMAQVEPVETPRAPAPATVTTPPASKETSSNAARNERAQGAAAQRVAAVPSPTRAASPRAEMTTHEPRPAPPPAPVQAPPPAPAVTTSPLTASLPRSDRNALVMVPLPATQPPSTPPPAAGAGAQAVPVSVAGAAPSSKAIALDAALVVEFASPDLAVRGGLAGGAAAGGAGAGGGGRGAAGGGGATGGGPVRPSTTTPVYWRILASKTVERSLDGGASWEPIAIDPPVTLTGGAAASSLVCWLVGPQGVILRAIDAAHFARVPFPETTNLVSIRAISARQATVTTADGRLFTTTDGGQTWTREGALDRTYRQ